MKITVEISETLLNEAKKVASREGTTVKTLIEQGLRHAISQRKQGRTFRLRKVTFKGRGLSAEAKSLGCEQLKEFTYEKRGR